MGCTRSIVCSAVLLLTGFILPASAREERRYIGVWQKGTGANLVSAPLDWSDLLAKGTELTKQGFRLEDVETFMTPSGRRYVGAWHKGSGTNLIVSPLVEGDFQKKRLEMKAKGLRLADFEVFRAGDGRLLFLGVWRNGTGAESMTGGLPFDKFVQTGNSLIANGLRLDDVEIVGSGHDRMYYGLWHSGTGANLIVSPLRPLDFRKKANEFSGKGLKLIDLEVLREGASYLYASVWVKGPGENRIRNLLTFPQMFLFDQQMVKQGYQLADLETFMAGVPDLPPPPDGDDDDGGGTLFPHPSNITYLGSTRVVVDFGTGVLDPPRITLPVLRDGVYLGGLPFDSAGPIFPDDACGITVRKALAFHWNKDGKQYDEFPFINVPESSSMEQMFGPATTQNPHPENPNFYMMGIGFTGPMGKCKTNTTPWRFPFPFTKDDPGAPAVEHTTLTIDLAGDSEIGFLKNEILSPPETAYESYLEFSNKMREKFKQAMEAMEQFDADVCGIETYVLNKCEELVKESHPLECPVNMNNYVPRC